MRASVATAVALACLLFSAAPVAAATTTGGASPAPDGAAAAGTPRSAARPRHAAAPRSAHLGQRTLRRGAHGHDVRVLQDLLTRAGFPTPVAGIFGPLTQRNVRAFQRSLGLRADGIVGKALAAALRRAASGGATVLAPAPSVTPAGGGQLLADGTALAPADAPAAVQAVVAAANRIATTPYLWGGGHARWEDSGYDCSGSVSYALHGGGLLDAAEDSGGLMTYGAPGPGRWITLYANADHVYAVIAGLRYDTSGASPSRWQSTTRSGDGYVVRHPAGL